MEHLQSPYYTTLIADTGLSLIGILRQNKYFINENLYNPVSNPTNTLSGTYLWSHNTSQETTLVQMITILVIYQGLQVSHCQELGIIRHHPGL
jgi:hypothetical protein